MFATEPHPWILTAPWWHWQLDRAPRDTAPAIQKYATPDVVNEFLARPQRRLVIDDLADRTQPPRFDLNTLTKLPPPKRTDPPRRLLKVYLPTHHRNYLVATELHCDAPGYPSPCRDGVCEAGFVVRRQTVDLKEADAEQAHRLLSSIARDRARLGVIDRRLRQAVDAGRIGASRFLALSDQRSSTVSSLEAKTRFAQDWAAAVGARRKLLGFCPVGRDGTDGATDVLVGERPGPLVQPLPGLGRWVPVAEAPDALSEKTYPLYPLIPDPTKPPGDGTDRTIYFGVLPTVTVDLQLAPPSAEARPRMDRGPQFDDLSIYEIRCYVRRHDPACPRRPGVRDCCGELVWSKPTEPYRLAGPSDARGTANRPVTIRLPSRHELEEGAAVGPGAGGIRIASPDIPLDLAMANTGNADFQICSFGIPLITIVATFVLKLFLPIVTFLFGLWILLAFRLCIPPSISLDAEALDALDLADADGDPLAAEGSVNAKLSAPATVATLLGDAATSLGGNTKKAGLVPDPALGDAGPPQFPTDATNTEQARQRLQLLKAMAGKRFTTPTDDLRYERLVQREQVGAG